jgi:hypothetical protein
VARIQRILDVPEHAIAASDAACAAIVKAKAKNFYYGMRLTPPDRRCHLYACYAWMRHADDQIDTAPDDAARRAALDQLYRQTHAALSGEPNRHDDSSFWPAFRSVVRSCPVEHRWLIEMLKGLEGITTHDTHFWVPIFENTQDIPALARQVEQMQRQSPERITHGFLIRRHGLYTWGRDIAAARRHVEIFEFLFECVARTTNLIRA